MSRFLCLVLCVSFFTARAQTAGEDTLVLKLAIKQLGKPAESLVYTDRADVSGLVFLLACLKSKERADYPKRREIKFLVQELNKQSGLSWPEHLFPGSVRIAFDSLAGYLQRAHARYIDESNQAVLAAEYSSMNPAPARPWVHTFTRPIFFRKGTLCLVYVQALCSWSGGSNDLYLYAKRDGTWQKVRTLAGGDW